MNLKTYKLINLLYDGIVAIESKHQTNYKVGDIYKFDDSIKGIVIKSDYYNDYDNGRSIIRVKLL